VFFSLIKDHLSEFLIVAREGRMKYGRKQILLLIKQWTDSTFYIRSQKHGMY